MQPQFMRNVLALSRDSVIELERAFRLPRRGSLYFRLVEAKIDHASAVLALLRVDDIPGVEVLVGHPIVVCPRQRFITPALPPRRDVQVIKTVGANPRLEATVSFARFACLRAGMTVSQALMRGVTRRDIREWRAEGSITVATCAYGG
jgi:hypothetical protein